MQALNILLIEDDSADAKIVEQLLQQRGIRDQNGVRYINITHTTSLNKGLDVLTQRDIDLILLDLHLPDGQGVDLVNRLQIDYSDVPIIILTGVDSEEMLGLELVRRGAQDYLPKNGIATNTLIRCIRYAIQRHQLSCKIQRQAGELQDANAELERFVYLLSHDLRAPLVNLQGFSTELQYSLNQLEKILDTHLPDLSSADREQFNREFYQEIPQSLRFIQSATAKMHRLTNAILDLSRLGKKPLRLETIDTKQLVTQCIEPLNHQIHAHNTEITLAELPAVTADRTDLEHVFGNIIDNALKYLTPDRPGKITLSASTNSTHTLFSIADNGRGIEHHAAKKVFEIFRRGGNAGDVAGAGLGMAFVQAILKRHGGDIWFDSTPNEGTTFHFTIAHRIEQDQGNTA